MFCGWIGRYNDLDGLAPIIYKLKDKGEDVVLYYKSSFPSDDYRLEFLRSYGVVVEPCDVISDIQRLNPRALLLAQQNSKPSTINAGVGTIVTVPNGPNIYSDHVDTVSMLRENFFCTHFISHERFGSAKYCPEWLEIHDNIYPRGGVEATNKYRVAMILNQRDDSASSRKILMGMDDIQLEIQVNSDTEGTNPSEIIDWADVTLIGTSCYGVEALAKDKNAYWLGYVSNRHVVYPWLCEVILNPADLAKIIRARTTATAVVRGWPLDKFLYNGDSRVLDNYYKFIMEV